MGAIFDVLIFCDFPKGFLVTSQYFGLFFSFARGFLGSFEGALMMIVCSYCQSSLARVSEAQTTDFVARKGDAMDLSPNQSFSAPKGPFKGFPG